MHSGSAETLSCALVFLTESSQPAIRELRAALVLRMWLLCQGFVMAGLSLVSLVQAGVRAEGAGVRPGLAFSTASFKDESLRSQPPCRYQ